MVTLVGDDLFMERALLLSERGRGRTSPNPAVGAVVVSQTGVVVGQGTTLEAGGPHAEICALEEAGGAARNATLYCTLEPCAHVGRTGPCVEAIVSAGIRRVVAAVGDPNPQVAGAGFDYLRARNIEVVEGLGREVAVRQHAAFFTWMIERRPFVTLKAAISRDGFVGVEGERVRVTGPEADRYFHRQRAEIDAIAVGSGTVLTDDPLLTARGAYRFRPLTRVVFDRRGRIPPTARLFSTLDAGPIMVVVSDAVASDRDRSAVWQSLGVDVQAVKDFWFKPILDGLGERGIVSLLVEGGPTLQRAFADQGLVDRIQWVVSPTDLGRGIPFPPELRPDALPNVVRQLGKDTLFEFDVYRTDRSRWPH